MYDCRLSYTHSNFVEDAFIKASNYLHACDG